MDFRGQMESPKLPGGYPFSLQTQKYYHECCLYYGHAGGVILRDELGEVVAGRHVAYVYLNGPRTAKSTRLSHSQSLTVTKCTS